MRSTDERMEEVFERTAAQRVATRQRRFRMAVFGGGAAGLAVVVFAALVMASLAETPSAPASTWQLTLMGSVIANASALGYVVVGLLGIVVGAALTVVAFRFAQPTSDTANPDDKEHRP